MPDKDYYADVAGGWVCRKCGSLVRERDTHDEWHEQIARPCSCMTVIG